MEYIFHYCILWIKMIALGYLIWSKLFSLFSNKKSRNTETAAWHTLKIKLGTFWSWTSENLIIIKLQIFNKILISDKIINLIILWLMSELQSKFWIFRSVQCPLRFDSICFVYCVSTHQNYCILTSIDLQLMHGYTQLSVCSMS